MKLKSFRLYQSLRLYCQMRSHFIGGEYLQRDINKCRMILLISFNGSSVNCSKCGQRIIKKSRRLLPPNVIKLVHRVSDSHEPVFFSELELCYNAVVVTV